MTHNAMPATSCVVLLIIALVIDLLSIGPGSIRDRVSFLIAIPALYAGWAGGALALWINSSLESISAAGLKSSGSDYIASASPRIVVACAVAAAFIYAVAAVIPQRAQKWVGPIARVDLARGKGRGGGRPSAPGKAVSITSVKPGASSAVTPGGGIGDAPRGARLNIKLWALALFLACTADLPQGLIGTAMDATISALTAIVSGIPNKLIGTIS